VSIYIESRWGLPSAWAAQIVTESPGRQCPTTETFDAAGEDVLETPGALSKPMCFFAAAHADGRPQRALPQKPKLKSLNLEGLERALKCRLGHLSMSSSASNSHSLKNVKRPSAEAFAKLLELIRQTVGSGLEVRVGIQCAFGCVHEGAVAEDRVINSQGISCG
jgi:hypothetical protein